MRESVSKREKRTQATRKETYMGHQALVPEE